MNRKNNGIYIITLVIAGLLLANAIIISAEDNSKENIHEAQLSEFMVNLEENTAALFGFKFPPHGKHNDTSYTYVKFSPIDIDERHEQCTYRDR